MKSCKSCSDMIAVLLPSGVASADPAKDACQNGMSSLAKQDYDAAITAFSDAIRLNAEYAGRRITVGASPMQTKVNMTRPSPIAVKRSDSPRMTPQPITAVESPTGKRGTTIKRSRITTKPFGSTQNSATRTTVEVLPAIVQATKIGRSPTTTRPFAISRALLKPSVLGAVPTPRRGARTKPSRITTRHFG